MALGIGQMRRHKDTIAAFVADISRSMKFVRLVDLIAGI
jgi:hypothetical protein